MPVNNGVWYNIYEQLHQNYIFTISTFSPICPHAKYQRTAYEKEKIMLTHHTVATMQYIYYSKLLYLKGITFSFALVFSLQSV